MTGCALSFFNLGAWGALYAVGPELYQLAVRGARYGRHRDGFGRIASMIAPLSVPLLGAGVWCWSSACSAVRFCSPPVRLCSCPSMPGWHSGARQGQSLLHALLARDVCDFHT